MAARYRGLSKKALQAKVAERSMSLVNKYGKALLRNELAEAPPNRSPLARSHRIILFT